MLHLVCLLLLRGSQDLRLQCFELLLPIPMMGFASSVAVQVIVLENACGIRINWHFLLLAVVMAVATINLAITMPGLHMVVGRLITLI
jgi:hypothetical protein